MGLKEGNGKYIFQNGDVYDGNWVDDKKNGRGKYYYASSGDCYEGEWRNNVKSG